MGHPRSELTWFKDLQAEAGMEFRLLPPAARAAFWGKVGEFLGTSRLEASFVSRWFEDYVIIPGAESVKYIGEILGDREGRFFFERYLSDEVFSVENGAAMHRFAMLQGADGYYVCDPEVTFLCNYDHEDYLMVTGSAAERALSLAPEAYRV